MVKCEVTGPRVHSRCLSLLHKDREARSVWSIARLRRIKATCVSMFRDHSSSFMRSALSLTRGLKGGREMSIVRNQQVDIGYWQNP